MDKFFDAGNGLMELIQADEDYDVGSELRGQQTELNGGPRV